jgi:hypothetical protein
VELCTLPSDPFYEDTYDYKILGTARGAAEGKGAGPYVQLASICRGAVAYEDRATLCNADAGAFVCSAEDLAYGISWAGVKDGKNVHAWVDDAMNVVVDGDTCMATRTPAASYAGAGTYTSCPSGRPMRFIWSPRADDQANGPHAPANRVGPHLGCGFERFELITEVTEENR